MVLTGFYWQSKQLKEINWHSKILRVIIYWHSGVPTGVFDTARFRQDKERYWQKCADTFFYGKIAYWHSELLNGVYWHISILTWVYWHTKVLKGVYWHSKLLTGYYWHGEQLTAVQWHSKVLTVVYGYSIVLNGVYWPSNLLSWV